LSSTMNCALITALFRRGERKDKKGGKEKRERGAVYSKEKRETGGVVTPSDCSVHREGHPKA